MIPTIRPGGAAPKENRGQRQLQRIVFLGMLIVSLFLCLALLRPFIISLCWAGVLAIGTAPLHRRLVVKLQPTAAAVLCCCIVFIAVLLPFALITTEIARESAVLSRQASALLPANNSGIHATTMHSVNTVYRRVLSTWKHVPIEWQPALRSAVQQAGSFAAAQSMTIVKNLVWIALEAGITLLTLFFLLRDAPRLWTALRPYLPFSEQLTASLFKRVNDLIYVGLFGLVVVAAVQGALDGVAFWIAGIPLPILWGTALAVASMIPFVGAPVVWVPASLYLALQGEYGKALGLAVWALLLHGITDHLLRPLFVGAYTRTHLLLTCLGIMGGLMLMGPIGLFLGPVILVVPLALLEMATEEFGHPTREAPAALRERRHMARLSHAATAGRHKTGHRESQGTIKRESPGP